MICNQLIFAEGFRADLIVARDTLESAFVALLSGKKFNRPSQLHILDDVLDPNVRTLLKISKFKFWIAKYLLKNFLSIRTKTDNLAQKIKKLYPKIPDVASLPRLNNFHQLPQIITDVKQKYKQFNFIILYIGDLNQGSKAYQAIDVARTQMRNKKIGLVIVGEGDSKAEFKKRAEVLGVKEQIVFDNNTEDVVSYLQTADLLLIPDLTDQGDDLSIAGVSAGIPMIMVETSLRLDLFEDHNSALLFKENDIPTFTNHLSKVLNEPNLRSDLVENAKKTIPSRINKDASTYKINYRDSVEKALFVTAE